MRTRVAAIQQLSAAFAAGDNAQIQSLGDQLTAAQNKANASANAYGLTECGKSASSGSSSSSTTTTAAPA